eukprot:Skav203714  [mRNA]  locus=scaffold259:561266:574309:- [translate_table: standard]
MSSKSIEQAMSSTFRISSSDPMRRRQANGQMYSPCLSVRLTKIRQSGEGSWKQIFKEVWQHKLMVKELGPFGPERFDGLNGARTFLLALATPGYNLDDPDFWGNVDHYVATTMKQSGYTSAPKNIAACKEHSICFLPSYKWNPGTDSYDMRSQKHVPVGVPRRVSLKVMEDGHRNSQPLHTLNQAH